jgi:hypothetical protein
VPGTCDTPTSGPRSTPGAPGACLPAGPAGERVAPGLRALLGLPLGGVPVDRHALRVLAIDLARQRHAVAERGPTRDEVLVLDLVG